MLLIDLGIIYQGYASDMTRTVCLGTATDQMQDIYGTVGQAQAAAISAMKPGASSHDIDQAARSIITEAGHGKSFSHGLGHSIGLETHDPGLNLSPFAPNATLAPGMAFTVEPGIYLENGFGVRTEEIFIITENDPMNITTQSHDLIELNI
jgi:Xaa-Pro aminopeptidase